jgi:acyl-CoA thioesterase
MTFDELLRAARGSEELTMPESWSQGRATFGGLTAALMFERMEKLVAEGRAMRSLQVSFVGPVEPEVPASFEAEILREGKAVSQVQGRIVQKGEPRLVCLATGGSALCKTAGEDQFPELGAGYCTSEAGYGAG